MSIMQQWIDAQASAHEKANKIIEELQTQTRTLSGVIQAIQSNTARQSTRRIQGAANADAAGLAVVAVTAPVGVAWTLIALAIGADTLPTGVNVYTETLDPINLIRVLTPGTRGYGDFPAGEYIVSGRTVLVEFTGLTPGARATINLLVNNLNDGG